MEENMHFEVLSYLGKKIRITKPYWDKIIETKHHIMEGKESIVKETLKAPTELRVSRKDPKVFLYYKQLNGKYSCVVTKNLNGEGFIITAYITDRIKAGKKYETN